MWARKEGATAQFSESDQTVEYDASSTQFAGTTDGTALSLWEDTGAGNLGVDLDNTGAQGDPVYRSTVVGGQPALRWSDDVLSSSGTAVGQIIGPSSARAFTAFAVVQGNTGQSGGTLLDWFRSSTDRFMWYRESGNLRFNLGSNTLSVASGTDWEGNAHVWTIGRNGTNAFIRVDGTELASATTWSANGYTTNTALWQMGIRPRPPLQVVPWRGDIAYVSIHDAALSTDVIADNEQALGDEYGITIGGSTSATGAWKPVQVAWARQNDDWKPVTT